VIELTTIYCPECGDAAEDMAPENEQDSREVSGYQHVGGPDGALPRDDPRRLPGGRAGRGRQ
jgi:hypothetical protein